MVSNRPKRVADLVHTLIPTLRRLRNVLRIVDILLNVQWLLRSKGRLTLLGGGTGWTDSGLAEGDLKLQEI
jgi:hypothetical protein